MQTATLSFFRFSSLTSRLWALSMMGAARLTMPRTPDIGFWKLCGSGSDEGFSFPPNTGVYAILATWPDLDTARKRIATAPTYARYRNRAAEDWTVFLGTTSVRGSWSGQSPFAAEARHESGPLAALTRATVKPKVAAKFWRSVPDISDVIGNDPNVLFKIGIGEVPLLQQVTFSIWPDTSSMAEFARRDGPHARAIQSVRDGDWFREELYARFTVLDATGTWGGENPLSKLTERPI